METLGKSLLDETKRHPDVCWLSKRVDGKFHSWRFDGDDPYVVCAYCGEERDAISGRVIKLGVDTAEYAKLKDNE